MLESEEAPLTPGQLAVLDAIGVNRAKVDELVASGRKPLDLMKIAVHSKIDSGELSPEAVYALGRMADRTGRYAGLDPDTQRAHAAALVRRVGVPVAAHAAVAGGAVLGLKGAFDVISRMQAGEPVEEEEVKAAVETVRAVSSSDEGVQ
jgi:hypothetical protein